MVQKHRTRTFFSMARMALVLICFCPLLFQACAHGKAQIAQTKRPAIDSAELDEAEPKSVNDPEHNASVLKQDEAHRKKSLPSLNELVEAKLFSLKKKQEQLEQELASAALQFAKIEAIDSRTFDSNAYLSLSIINSAPPLDYGLKSTEIIIDGKRVARGGKRNRGLPRAREIFFGAVAPGCHEIVVKAQYVRLKNDLISQFKVNRIERVVKSQTFVAKNGHRVEIEIEGFEAHNSLANFYRGPAVRFNRSVRPNFLPGSSLISLDEVLNQGRVHIEYSTADTSLHRLIEKSVSIDGLPVLTKEQHDSAKAASVVFDGPLAEGKHRVNVTLLFGENTRVGGPLYNFRLKFDRDFHVISGQSTIINLVGLPNDGFKGVSEASRYARAESRIVSRENSDFFPEMTCKELLAKEQERSRLAKEDQN